MKYRNLLTNIFYVVILISLVLFLLIEFGVMGMSDGMKRVVSTLLLALAVLSVAMIEIVLPVIANRDMLKNKKYVVRAVIKTVLLLASAVVLFMFEPFGVIKDMTTALVIFCVTYFLQFFISLEPKLANKNSSEKKASGSKQGTSAPRTRELRNQAEPEKRPEPRYRDNSETVDTEE